MLLILTASLAIFTLPGTFGAAVGDAGISPEQATGAVVVTVLDCGGNRIANAVVQVQGLSSSQWKYTGDDGVATIVVPVGTCILFKVATATSPSPKPSRLARGAFPVTVNVGAGCNSSSNAQLRPRPKQQHTQPTHKTTALDLPDIIYKSLKNGINYPFSI